MGERYDRGHTWEDDPIGVVYSEKRHRWAHRWSEYLVITIGVVGTFAAIGAAMPFSFVRMAGALMILAGAFSFSRSDRAHRSSVRRELVWDAAGVVLLIGGLLVFGFGS